MGKAEVGVCLGGGLGRGLAAGGPGRPGSRGPHNIPISKSCNSIKVPAAPGFQYFSGI